MKYLDEIRMQAKPYETMRFDLCLSETFPHREIHQGQRLAAAKPLLLQRLAAMPVLLALIVWMEADHPVPTFRLFTFLFVLLVAADLASFSRGRARDGLIVLASFAIGLCVLEGIAIVLEPKILMTVTDGWSVRRPVLGWGPEHPGRFHAEKRDPKTGTVIYLVDYTIDANLLRQTTSNEKGPAIVFFGDSFTFGMGVADSDTLPQIFADLLDRKQRVLNLGFSGYGPQQFLRELETGLFDPLIGGQPRLFIFMTFAGHAERTACKPHWLRLGPHYGIENSRITFKGACYEGPSLGCENGSRTRPPIGCSSLPIDRESAMMTLNSISEPWSPLCNSPRINMASRRSSLISGRVVIIFTGLVSAMTPSSHGCGGAEQMLSMHRLQKSKPKAP